jgi:hypothetical protein
MSKTDAFVKQTESMLNRWCGAAGYARLKAVAGGAATSELIEKLRGAEKSEWYEICRQHGKERAEDISWYMKPGDLFYRDGNYFWGMYWWSEFEPALKAVGAGRVRRRKAVDAAQAVFVETVKQIRIRRIGTPEERKAKEAAGFPGVEFSETFGMYRERVQREGGS